MACAKERVEGTSVVVITDSRGRGIEAELSSIQDRSYSVKVLVWKGRGVTEAVKESKQQLIWMAPDVVIVLAGICDLTSKNRNLKMVSLSFESVDEAVNMFTCAMDIINHFLNINLVEKKFKLSFGQVVGMDIGVYNHLEHPHPLQSLLDEAVIRINNEIATRNSGEGVATPWVANEVHHNRKKGQKITRYQRLADDGLHLTSELKQRWATHLHRAIIKIIEK